MLIRCLFVALLLLPVAPAAAGAAPSPAPFDLAGPALRVSVTHGQRTLPLAQVPNLSAGDRLAIKADLPADQTARYLMVVAFLRGATNPPPVSWFFRDETWTPKGHDGLSLTIPAGAEQAVVMLAPETGGAFDTLVGAVRGQPGAFVRAAQDLNQASLDRARLAVFIKGVSANNPANPSRLDQVAPVLARSLRIKLNPDCLQKQPELQPACLMEDRESLILDDGHSESISDILTSPLSTDLAFRLSATPQAGYGYYSPYIGAIRDIVGLLGSFHTAHYQYLPALGVADGSQLDLLLNAVPSFRNPKSVLVAALPAVKPSVLPPLQAVGPNQTLCIDNPDLVLPVEGAPLIYATTLAHDMVLRTNLANGDTIELPVRADPEKGGLVVDVTQLKAARIGTIEGRVYGEWGFEPLDGPSFHLESSRADAWRLADTDSRTLVVGRDNLVHLTGGAAACVTKIALSQGTGEPSNVQWNSSPGGPLAVTVPLTAARQGTMRLLISSFGQKDASTLPLKSFEEAARLDEFHFYAGDTSGVLSGNRLDEVASLSIDKVNFVPTKLDRIGHSDQLTLTSADSAASAHLFPKDSTSGRVLLKDGRTTVVKVRVEPSRPQVAMISKSLVLPPAAGPLAYHLGENDLPGDARITFSIRAAAGTQLTGQESLEVATEDGTAATVLTDATGLVREDTSVAVATFEPAKVFSSSAFGPLRFRLVKGGVASDWQSLGTLVRTPSLRSLRCGGAKGHCRLSGDGLFLISETASDLGFAASDGVPEGFTGNQLEVAHPTDGRLYVRLRDDPQTINQIIVKTPPPTMR
jgi:hypothetical protein